MHQLILKNVGPIKNCEVSITDFNVFTGAQASGKSTIAKSVFFFRTVKDDIFNAIMKRNAMLFENSSLYKTVQKTLRNKFLQIFGTSRAMNNELLMEYHYDDTSYIRITLRLKEGADFISPNYVYFDFSKNIIDFLSQYNSKTPFSDIKTELTNELNFLFNDKYDTIFIPAGRSLITLLTTQLSYIFTSMDESQKRTIDYCTQKYIELISKIRPLLTDGIMGYYESMPFNKEYSTIIRKAINLTNDILKGRYVFSNGEEKLFIDSDRFIKINFTSSGQQEAVWIFNILLYQLINNKRTFIILEEPEAHLYPDAQKQIMELLSLFMNSDNSLLITTHSPYILGAINNLLYASQVYNKADSNKRVQVERIISKDYFIQTCNAYFVNDGLIETCIDTDDSLIINEVIDGASQVINNDYDALFDIIYEEGYAV